MKNFSKARNTLLHGNAILTTTTFTDETHHSDAKKMLTIEFLKKQIERFCFILEGMRFYNQCVIHQANGADTNQWSERMFLQDDFIPEKYKSSGTVW